VLYYNKQLNHKSLIIKHIPLINMILSRCYSYRYVKLQEPEIPLGMLHIH
jgi:hypothetical protein